jgi:anaerobic selenocysteine-containing dehydrogenase
VDLGLQLPTVAALHGHDPLWAADTCGFTTDTIEQAALLFGRAKAAALFFTGDSGTAPCIAHRRVTC